jgi:predicted AlkP superfamily phosphohydrolase/phosphomutase
MIGIDSMDRELIDRYIDYLPNFRKLLDTSPRLNLTSVFPPDSDTAWASIYTGLNPAKHGIVLFVDPLEKASIQETDYLDISTIKGKTFWDIAGRHGKKVCLIFPHAAYPVWPVNGFMISPIPKIDGFQMYPPDFKFSFACEHLEVPKRIPDSSSEYAEYLEKFKKIVKNEFDFGNHMMKHYDWDLFFFYSCALDFIQHIFWNYCDPKDPSYPGPNKFENAIRDFYVLHDILIGEMLKNAGPDIPIIIISDHGHSMRPVNLLNINELLWREGYLVKKGSKAVPFYKLKEKIKRSVVDLAQRTNMRKLGLQILRRFPKVKEMYTIPSLIDFDRTIAHCSDMSGLKSYTYGGIIIQKGKLPIREYERVQEAIINLLRTQTIPGTEEKIFEWVMEREELYSGEFISKYPDIVFQLKNNYGAGWAINIPLFSETAAHSFFPGTHRGDTPILFIKNLDPKKIIRYKIILEDITPTILDILGIPEQVNIDGKSILIKSE